MIIIETEKLYSPLNFYLRDNDYLELYDNNQYWRDELSHGEAAGFLDKINLFLRHDHERKGTDRGIMAYCRSSDINDKVYSLIPSIELYGDKLWLVAELRLNKPLSDRDMADLKSWWGGQLSDGWGERIGQQEIKVDRGDLYLEPWTATAGFFIATHDEFTHRLGVMELKRMGIHFPTAAEEQDSHRPERESAHTSRNLDGEELAALKLSARLEQNLADYTEQMMKTDIQDVIGNAKKIAAMQDAHQYLTEEHEFTADEVALLLKFQNPLSLVSDNWPTMTSLIDVSHVMRDIFRQRDTLRQHYAPVTDTPEAPEEKVLVTTGLEFTESSRDMSDEKFQDKMSALIPGYDPESMQSIIAYAWELDQEGICEPSVFFRKMYVEFYLVTQQYGPELSQRLLDVFKTVSLNADEVRGASHHLNSGADSERIMQLAIEGKCGRTMAEREESEDAIEAFIDGLLEVKTKLPPSEHDVEALKQELFDRLEQNYDGMMSVLRGEITRPGLTQQELVNKAGEIAAVDDAHFYMTNHHEFDVLEIQYLMQFQNPLEIVADAWEKRTDDISDMSFALNDVFNKQDALHSEYELASDTNTVAEDNGHRSNGAVNPSVLAQIRDATRAPKEPRKDKPARDKSEPEH